MLFFDIEANGFYREATTIYCLSIGTEDGQIDDYSDYARGAKPLSEGLARLAAADCVAAHHLLGYDYWVVEKLYPGTFKADLKKVDTLILFRMQNPESRHSLQLVGERVGVFKQEYTGGFDAWNPDMLSYCHDDVAVLVAGWKLVKDYARLYPQAVALEHELAEVLFHMEQHGFRLDVPAAVALERELRGEVETIERELQRVFPAITHARVSEKTGKPLKPKIEVFNPGSRQQIADRLKNKYGWKPAKFTPSGQAQVDEEVLAALPYSEAALLLDSLNKQKMLGQLTDGKNGWLKLVDAAGYVHGVINANGTRTFRGSHYNPNMGQVSKKDSRMRSVWTADPGWVLVGCDADALQLRILAHFTAKTTSDLIQQVDAGDKEKGTDIHSRNRDIAGFHLRDSAKTLIYAFLFGAGVVKLGLTAQDDARDAKKPALKGSLGSIGSRLKERLIRGVPGLAALQAKLDRLFDKSGGLFHGLDGRPVVSPEKRLSLVTIIQCAEAVIMKTAIVLFHRRYWGSVPYHYCAWVHDEIQFTCPQEHAQELGKGFAECLTEAGKLLGVRCPIRGNYAVGDNWFMTH